MIHSLILFSIFNIFCWVCFNSYGFALVGFQEANTKFDVKIYANGVYSGDSSEDPNDDSSDYNQE